MKFIRIEKLLNGRVHIFLCNIKIFSYRFKKKQKPVSLKKYSDWIFDLQTNKSLFVPITSELYKRKSTDPKIFTYYLTQYHSIPENDKAYGKGFTEWTNVSSCMPQFIGQFQPQIPYDVSFYNLTDINVMKRQVELAKMYGIYGFCFYYYWFSGKKALEKPLYNFLNSDIDFKFHLCWANENWSKLWDGGNQDIIFEQKLNDGDADKFFNDILPFIKDQRYEKIDNKPILMIYRPSLFDKEKIKQFLLTLDSLAKEHGLNGFYFMASNCRGFNQPKEYGFEGIIEFPPHTLTSKCPIYKIDTLVKSAKISCVDMKDFIENKKYIYDADYTVFKCCFPKWDNSSRKTYSNAYYCKMTPELYKQWLSGIIDWTRQNNHLDKQYVYINAWNEWAEGAHLEPDTRYGYQSLDITKQCLEDCHE